MALGDLLSRRTRRTSQQVPNGPHSSRIPNTTATLRAQHEGTPEPEPRGFQVGECSFPGLPLHVFTHHPSTLLLCSLHEQIKLGSIPQDQGQDHALNWAGNLTPTPGSVQFSHSVVSNSATTWTAARQASLSITNSLSLLKLVSIESVMPSNHLILSSPSPPTLNLSQHQGLFK